MPVRVIVTKGSASDCKYFVACAEDIDAEHAIADRAYDTDEIREYCKKNGIEAVIPPKKNRTDKILYDEYLYKLRHLAENIMLKLKRWRGIATRYAKRSKSFIAIIQIRCIALWAQIS